MEIKVLGAGCSSCSRLYSNVEQAVKELDLDLDVNFVHDIAQILTYNALQMPALIINGKVISSGEDLSVREIKAILQQKNNE